MEWIDPYALGKIDYVRLRFFLQFRDRFHLTLNVLLQMRRELKMARDLMGQEEQAESASHFEQLLNPGNNSDPHLRRIFPIRPPAFVIQPPENLPADFDKGDCLPLEVVFWGEGRQLIGAFHSLLTVLGSVGLYKHTGMFSLLQTEAQTPDGFWYLIGSFGEELRNPALPLLTANDLTGQDLQGTILSFLTPARLLVKGRPLFAPDSGRLLPFFLRRVTSMCQAWCGVDLIPHPAALINTLNPENPERGDLQWKDWRTLDRGYATQDLGGVVGSFELPASWQTELALLFNLVRQLNLGKGAAYGGGAWRLS